MTATHITTGRDGEDLAAAYLAGLGYKILERNFRTARGEIDCIAKDGGQIVFVEVKTRRTKSFGSGLEAVGGRKRDRLLLAGQYYMQGRKEKDFRFDVLSILLEEGKAPEFTLVKNAFGG